MREFKTRRDQGSWVLGCVGSYSLQEVTDMLQKTLAGWQPKAGKREFPFADQALATARSAVVSLPKDREQTHIVVGHRGIAWSDPDRPALDVMATILGGTGGRLFTKLRDQNSLAYTVTPLVTYGCHPGVMAAYIACANDKAEKAQAALIHEMDLLCDELASDTEVERAINYLVGGHEADMQRSDSQSMTMALMEAYGVGYDDFLTYPSRIEHVTKQDVQRVAQRLVRGQSRICVAVGSGDR